MVIPSASEVAKRHLPRWILREARPAQPDLVRWTETSIATLPQLYMAMCHASVLFVVVTVHSGGRGVRGGHQ